MKYFFIGKDLIRVDDEDFDRLKDLDYRKENDHYYARLPGNKMTSIQRLVLKYFGPLFVCHEDNNPKNNQKNNLTLKTLRENSHDRKDNVSGCSGVGFHKLSGKWRARTQINGVPIFIGSYETKEEAITARNNYERGI